eukprot:m.239858 g.239858  ORF g.239858 m.239858 type:complete len:456 (-) comp14141_c0_seq1:78-1445(-)
MFRSVTPSIRRFLSVSAAVAAEAPQTQITTLSNGMRVVTETSPLQTATIGVHVDAGSRFESEKTNGIAHFLEHMAFKGSKNYTKAQLESLAEQSGFRLEAYTSRESTVFTARCFSSDVNKVTSVLGDIVTSANYDEAAVTEERGVILREAQEVASIPEEVVLDYLHASAFQGSSLGYTILGPDENIKSVTRDDLVNYVQTFYTGPRMVLVGTGGVDHDELVKAAEQYFGSLSSEDKAPATPPTNFHGSEVNHRDDSQGVAKYAIAMEGVSWSDPDFFNMLVASSIVGQWDRNFGAGKNMASPLSQIVSEEGSAHNFMSFQTSYSDTGLWGCYAVSDVDKVEDFAHALTQEWLRIAFNVTPSEITRTKNRLKSAILFSADNTHAVNDEIGRQMLSLGRRVPKSEILASFDAVTDASVRKAMMKFVYDKDPAVAAIGATEQLPDYNRLRSSLYWLRT